MHDHNPSTHPTTFASDRTTARSRRLAWPLLAVLALAACGRSPARPEQEPSRSPTPVSASDVKREVIEAARTTGAYLGQKWQEAAEIADRQLSELDGRLEKLRARASDSEAWKKAQAEIEEKRTALAGKLEQLKRSTADEREEVGRAVSVAAEELERAYQRAAERLGEPPAPVSPTPPVPPASPAASSSAP